VSLVDRRFPLSLSLSLSLSLAAPHTRHTQAVLTARRAATQRRATASRAGVHGPSPRASRSRGSFVLSSSSGYRSRERTHVALLVDHRERARQCSRRPLLALGRAFYFEILFTFDQWNAVNSYLFLVRRRSMEEDRASLIRV